MSTKSLQDDLLAFYTTALGHGGSVIALEREFFILSLGGGYSSSSWADCARAYYAGLNSSNPAGSLHDEAFKYYSTLSGLTPAARYSITDHMWYVFDVLGGPSTGPVPPTTGLVAYYDGRLGFSGVNDNAVVSSWTDQSVNVKHATQGAAAAKPLYRKPPPTSPNLIPLNVATQEEVITQGVISNINATITQKSATKFKSGAASCQVVAASNGNVQAMVGGTGVRIPVTAGSVYSASVSISAATATGKTATITIQWLDNADSGISVSVASASVAVDTTFQTMTLSGITAPALSVGASIIVNITSALTTETYFIDEMGMCAGSVATYTPPNEGLNNLLSKLASICGPTAAGFTPGTSTPTVVWSTAAAAKTAGFGNIGSILMTATVASTTDMITPLGEAVPVTAGKWYGASIMGKSAAGTVRAIRPTIRWLDNANATLSNSNGTGVMTNAATWVNATMAGAKAPVNAVKAQLIIAITSPAISDALYVAKAGIYESGANDVVGWKPPLPTAIQSKGCVVFDGVDDSLAVTVSAAAVGTIYSVAYRFSHFIGINGDRVGGITGGVNHEHLVDNTNDFHGCRIGAAFTFSTIPYTTYAIITTTYDGAAGKLAINSAAQTNAGSTSGNQGTLLSLATDDSGSYLGCIALCAFLVYNVVHDAGQRASVEAWLKSTWGTP